MGDGGRRPLGHIALGAVGFPATIWALNRAGLGPLGYDLSGPELRRSGLQGIAAVTSTLDVRGGYVVFGHTHRGGPWTGDDPAEWRSGATQLMNPGSWVYEELFLADDPHRNPYWPGNAIRLADSGPPELVRLVGDRPAADVRPPVEGQPVPA